MTEAPAPEERPPARPQVRPSIVAAAVGIITLAVHARAIDGTFVWDDREIILRSPLVVDARPIGDYFTRPFWNERFVTDGARAFFRPIVTLSYRLDYLLHGATPFGFHLTNVLLHAAVAVMLLAWMRRLGAAVLPAAACALLWALHPRLTESVSWVAGRTDVLAAFFMFAALLAWPDAASADRGRAARARRWGAALLFLFGLLSKEVAIAGGVAIAVIELQRSAGARAAVRRLLPLAAALVVYAPLRLRALRGLSEDPDAALTPWYAPFAAIARYATMLVDPRANAQIGDLHAPSRAFAYGGALLLVPLAYLAYRAARAPRSPLLAPAAMAAVGLGLVVHVIRIPVNVIACDRFLYVPLAGLLATIALVLTRAPARLTKATLAAMAALATGFGWLTLGRIDDWRDELRFWLVTAEQAAPSNVLPASELANVLYRDKIYGEALAFYQALRGRWPSEGSAARRNLANIASCLALLGHYDEALALREWLVDAEPESPRVHYEAGLVELHAQRFAAARARFEKALALAPDYDDASKMLAVAVDAEREWPSLREPSTSDAARARALARIGARVEADRAYLAVTASPQSTDADRLEAASYLVNVGDLPDAVQAVSRLGGGGGGETGAALRALLEDRVAATRAIAAALPDIRRARERYTRDR